MTNRDGGEDRLALALIDAAAPVTLAVDGRKRMALLTAHDDAQLAWPREVRTRPLGDPSQRRVRVALAIEGKRALVLPHTDIMPGTLYLASDGGRMPLEPVRDYAVNEAEGRVLLTPSASAWLARDAETTLEASYTVPVFAVQTVAGAAIDEGTWARPVSAREAQRQAEEADRGLLGRVSRWWFGEG